MLVHEQSLTTTSRMKLLWQVAALRKMEGALPVHGFEVHARVSGVSAVRPQRLVVPDRVVTLGGSGTQLRHQSLVTK